MSEVPLYIEREAGRAFRAESRRVCTTSPACQLVNSRFRDAGVGRGAAPTLYNAQILTLFVPKVAKIVPQTEKINFRGLTCLHSSSSTHWALSRSTPSS